MGPRLGRVEYVILSIAWEESSAASMGPRLGRVEYLGAQTVPIQDTMLQWGHA